jgi:hypothetical protein
MRTRLTAPARLAALLALVAAIALAAVPAQAAAKRHFTSKKAIWGPVERGGKSQFPIYHDLGAGIWEHDLNWANTAPTKPADPTDPNDPAYQWPPELDQAIAQAKRNHIRVMLLISKTPGWANGDAPPHWVSDDPQTIADFAKAASRRYPDVRLWMIWGEPNRSANFEPMTPEKHGRSRLTKAQARAPRLYARMVDASYAALKSVRRSNLVIGGNTFTVGEISPYNWIRYMRLPNGRTPRMDMFGHNPFTARRPNLNGPHPTGTDKNYSDFSDLKKFANVLDRNIRDPRGRPLKLFLSEFFFPTDHANHEFPYHVTKRVQASWLKDALRLTAHWSRIYTLGWFSLYDDPPRGDGREVNRGLMTYKGKRKPSYNVFRSGL